MSEGARDFNALRARFVSVTAAGTKGAGSGGGSTVPAIRRRLVVRLIVYVNDTSDRAGRCAARGHKRLWTRRLLLIRW